ncbi:hypothetical protein GNZ12_16170 [Paraburkholderia sp. 1N]|uniref:Uncharacterized protein n=1 Tax=Paraburkholderia solitsugae TaxID=2675748 RepID=A0ABX2BSL7_9BURK|nr:hypothetical protein [Paraburkholderia solitsugae]NPT42818.1 hypothetical protein [Paraburkholderia solitsugae]
MKTRSPLILCLPLALFFAACLLSLSTFVIAVVWMAIGVMALGHRTFESFPSTGIRQEWLRGYRSAFVWFYHLAWWPWYMRSPIRDTAGQMGAALRRTKKSQGKRPDSPSDHQSNGDRE